MAYILQADLETRYGETEILQLADRDGDEEHDTGVIDTAIADAESTVDRFLSQKTVVPVAAPSNDIKRLTSDIARFYLYDNAAPEHVENNYKLAIETLTNFANGELLIEGVSVTGDLAINCQNHTRVFTEESLQDY